MDIIERNGFIQLFSSTRSKLNLGNCTSFHVIYYCSTELPDLTKEFVPNLDL